MPDGYVCVRVDSRGAGRSPGYLDVWSPRETQDLYQCIEWAGTQPWRNGKVGINGISYYAMNQWQVAALKPLHLAALCIWEGASDYYREVCRHGGILCDFLSSWHPRQVASMQHGVGKRGAKNVVTGELVAGPETSSDAELEKNRADPPGEAKRRRLLDHYYAARTAEFEKIEAPLLSAANWGGMGLHPRGNFEGWLRAGSKQKWLEVHGDTRFTHFYSGYGEALQKRFFGHFLKGEDTGWEKQPRVALNIRHPGEKFVLRAESEWPLARTQWTKYFLAPRELALGTDAPVGDATLSYETTGDGLTFRTQPLTSDLEITGPVAAKLWVSSETTDADLFLVLRVFDPDGKEVAFIGSNDPRVPVGLGWLRASHRKLDLRRSLPYRPWHRHDEEWPLPRGEPVEVDIEIWPTSIVVPCRYRSALTVRGKDYEYDGSDAGLANAPYPMKRLPVHARRSGRPPSRDVRLPQYAPLPPGHDALSLVARDPAVVSFSLRSAGKEIRCGASLVWCWRFSVFLRRRHRPRRSHIRAGSSPSLCPIRRAGRPINSRAYWRRRCRTSWGRISSSRM